MPLHKKHESSSRYGCCYLSAPPHTCTISHIHHERVNTWTSTWSENVQPEVTSPTVVPWGNHWGSRHMMSYWKSPSPNPVLWQESRLCVNIHVVFLLDDTMCALCSGWVLWLVCSVLWVSGCVTADCNGWTPQGGKSPAVCMYLRLFVLMKNKTYSLNNRDGD